MIKKTFSLDEETWEYLKQQPNMSKYICNLIKKDKNSAILTKEEVIKIIKEYLENKNMQNIDVTNLIKF